MISTRTSGGTAHAAALAVCGVLLACAGDRSGPGGQLPPPDTTATVQTDRMAYVLEPQNELWVTEVPFVFRNTSQDTLEIGNCNGQLVGRIERWSGKRWEPFWHALQSVCASPPVVVAPGASTANAVLVWGWPTRDPGPFHFTSMVDGATYRLTLDEVTRRGQLRGDTIAASERRSNAFSLQWKRDP